MFFVLKVLMDFEISNLLSCLKVFQNGHLFFDTLRNTCQLKIIYFILNKI